MGYDMSVVNEDGHSVRDCDNPKHGEHYWRRNIFGGRSQAQRLVDAGMAYWSKRDDGDWPDVPGAKYDDEGEPANDAAREEERLIHAFLKRTYDERPGIAAYKLCDSNDGWWVTQVECETALKLWEKAGKPEVDEYGDTIPFLREAADHAGFRVW